MASLGRFLGAQHRPACRLRHYTNQAAYSVLQNLGENLPLKTVANPLTPLYTTESILSANPTGAIGANSVNHDVAIEYNEVWNLALEESTIPPPR